MKDVNTAVLDDKPKTKGAKVGVKAKKKPMPKRIEHFVDSSFPFSSKMKRKEYEKLKTELQIELLKLESWVQATGQKIVLLFEGRDAAGKGGTIKRFMEHLNPRSASVAALTKPTERERTQWFFQRYVEHLPAAGGIVFFDRSWYNRAGVERVMGFCTAAEYEEFMRSVPDFELMLVNSGIMLFKYWFSVSREEQRRRFMARKTDPLKRWKLSPIDKESLTKWSEYTAAKKEMFLRTDTQWGPWTIIKSDDKKRARLNCMRDLLSRIDYDQKDPEIAREPEEEIVAQVSELLAYDPSLMDVTG